MFSYFLKTFYLLLKTQLFADENSFLFGGNETSLLVIDGF